MILSWPVREGWFGSREALAMPDTDAARLALMKEVAATWVEPFRSLVLSIPNGTEVKPVDLSDFAPPRSLKGKGRVVLMGDALHAMAMCK
jgi:2-polyprenyl-6-methoxyphenol hydroxylase-like FAD-dependent oxidoreductase